MANPYMSKAKESLKLQKKAHKIVGESRDDKGGNYVPKTAREPTTSKWADVPRKARGGEVGHKYPKFDAGAGSGEGRLEKKAKY